MFRKRIYVPLLITGISIGLLASISWTSYPQKDNFKPYTQKISGTSVTFGMAPIPEGTFKMGSAANNSPHREDEVPQHKVKIAPFWMGTHEITWDVYEMFLNKDYEQSVSDSRLTDEVDAVSRPTTPYLDMTFGMGKENMPAIGMTQYNAIQFCKWLYAKTGVFYRLPTEAEWEYACRAGSTSDYFFGNSPEKLDQYAWYAANSEEKTHQTGQKEPNPWGLYDILGNVMEWTIDQYTPETYGQRGKVTENPVVKATELYPRAIRGGSYKSTAEDLRSARRFASTPNWKKIDPQMPKSNWWFPEAPFLGIRVVRPLNPPSEEEIISYYNQEPIEDY
ncbi:formylglycine-generating enzyme family protein [Sinomicrobium weinanense]|uniref:Formylglycine-generating enzyme family protein n=1 Tax=Sinomicrobium weinanense TaxID=2842200 RepID=A0A926JR74_9FLAO|nr:formylglycine-generating enzyme family protein [Sinomicrobium weinanense]MBC9796005.1 formylglycine-generating enzyme family protein [Sinomicrobium weinanense]